MSGASRKIVPLSAGCDIWWLSKNPQIARLGSRLDLIKVRLAHQRESDEDFEAESSLSKLNRFVL
jgi:hypothetical protein